MTLHYSRTFCQILPESRYGIKMGGKVTRRTCCIQTSLQAILFSQLSLSFLPLPAQLSMAGKVAPRQEPTGGAAEGEGPRACSSSPREESRATGHSRVSLKETKALARVCVCPFMGLKDLHLQSRIKVVFSACQSTHLKLVNPLQARADCPLPCNRALLRYTHPHAHHLSFKNLLLKSPPEKVQGPGRALKPTTPQGCKAIN